jgi:hypothetical protein
MKSITQDELEALFFDTDRTQFVSFVSVTDPDMHKRKNPHPKARKVSIVVGVINFQYSRTVNTQRTREQRTADFKALRRKWGKRLKGCPLVKHAKKGESEERLYLEVKLERRSALYFEPTTGKKIKESKLAPFLKGPDSNPRQQLNREITLRDYRLTSIAELTMNGKQYRIAPAAAELQTYIQAPKPMRAKAKATAAGGRITRTATRKRRGAT